MRGKWKKTVLRLAGNHGWKAKPGYKIFVADRGAVRFDYPADWVVIPGDDSIRFHDRKPPDDNVVLQLSVIHLPPITVDWSELPLERMLREAVVEKDERGVLSKGEIVCVKRPDLELAWTEVVFFALNEKREARSRSCLARGSNIQPLITMDYWPEDAARFIPVWDEVLRSLQLGQYVKDPTSRRLT